MCQIETLGERIRKFRKQQHLTLEALAGNELTKGMLSLIENNKANPSMESLNYIAEQLGVEVAELLEEVSTKELREVLEKAEKLYHVEYDEATDEYEQIIALVEPLVPKLTQGYEAARLLELFGRSLYHLDKGNWVEILNKAADIYEGMNIVSKRAAIGMFRAMSLFMKHKYEESLAMLLVERNEIEAKNAYIDPLIRLDFDYWEAALYYAVGDMEAASRVMASAIAFSKEKRVFFNIDNLYRLAAAHAMMTGDEEKTTHYVNKLKLYGEFADDSESEFFTNFLEVHYLNSYKQEYEKALELLNVYMADNKSSSDRSAYLYLEKGKSLYGMERFDEALELLNGITVLDYLHHPLDLSTFFEKEAYIARCHLALGNKVEAEKYAKVALDNISEMPNSPYKNFISNTYKLICE